MANRVLLDSGSSGDLLFLKKGASKDIPVIIRAIPQSWGTSNGTFVTDKVGDIEISFWEYSKNKKVHLQPDIVEYRPAWLVMSATCRRHGEMLPIFVPTGQIWRHVFCVSAHFCVAISRHVRTKDRQLMYVDRYTHYRIPMWTPLSHNRPGAHQSVFSHPKTHTTTHKQLCSHTKHAKKRSISSWHSIH
jgi:hypothetical protein